jgi:hypothetical protein
MLSSIRLVKLMGCVDELATYDVLDDAIGFAEIVIAMDGVSRAATVVAAVGK